MSLVERQTHQQSELPRASAGPFCVFVASGDSRRDIFEIVFQNAERIWHDCYWPRYVGFTSKHPNLYGFATVAAKNPSDWRGELGEQLDQLSPDIRYVLLIIEDFFFTSPIDAKKLRAVADYILKHDLAYVRLVPVARNLFGRAVEFIRRKIDKRSFRILKPSEPYYSSVEVAIWRRDYLRQLLRVPGSIWEFENMVGPERHYAVWEPIAHYRALVSRGKWNYSARRLLVQQGYSLNGSTRPHLSLASLPRRMRTRIIFSVFGYLSYRLRRSLNRLPRK